MKRLAMVFGILLAIMSLNACINSSSPDNKTVVQIPLGTEQVFKVSVSGISTTSWTLDGEKVGTGTTYAYFADQVGNYALKATNGPDSVTWNIEVSKPLVTFYKDADADGYGTPDDTISAQEQPVGYVANADDCDDDNAEISPDVTAICADHIGSYCLNGEVVSCPVGMVVSASDIDSGKTNVEITWTPVAGATHYNVLMSVEDDGVYESIATGITGTSYVYVEDWQDIVAEVGTVPLLPPGSTVADRDVFTIQLQAYRDSILPLMHEFKKEKRFLVQTCNGAVCDALGISASDLGQAELVHTAAFSEVSEIMTLLVGYPMLICLADSPPGIDALNWPGLTVPGPLGEGEMRGYIDKSNGVYVYLVYDNYTDGYLPSKKHIVNGEIGGLQDLIEAAEGIIRVKGKVIATGEIDAEVTLKAFISASADIPNDGTIWVLYKGQKFSFPLPL